MPLQQAQDIQLKGNGLSDIPDEHRTQDRDEVARYILTQILPQDRWPMQMIDLADETGYSRQHVSNVLKHYFEPVDDGPSEFEQVAENGNEQTTLESSVNVNIPDDVQNKESYLRGWVAGYSQRDE